MALPLILSEAEHVGMSDSPSIIRRQLLLGALASAGAINMLRVGRPSYAELDAQEPAQAGINTAGKHGFDFLVGDWHVHHRRISAVSKRWVEFDGTCSLRLLMDGHANFEEHELNSPDGFYRAAGLRSFDEKSGMWSIWWLDGRYPEGPIAPVQGRFENGIGAFYADYEQDGKPMRGRLLWSHITATSARWQQAASADGGKTWQPNWFMELQRRSNESVHSAATKKSDFALLTGKWRVQHRYVRMRPEGNEWVEAHGTCSHRELRDGWANVEEFVTQASGRTNHAVALRSYNPKTARWTVWWLDGRYPSTMEAPMQGHFEHGIGTFYGDTTLGDKPVRVRFIWSDITATSASWQQAYSYDHGKTWETVWIKQLQRTA
jgi:hypothetical protein